jgi:DNA replication and repair protein RecF
MRIDEITLFSFRNYENERFRLCPGVNIIDGDNAQGKTNLLEAVYYLTCARSFRGAHDRELVLHGSPFSVVRASAFSRGMDYDIETTLYPSQRRKIIINSVVKKSAVSLVGTLAAVLFCPEDLYLIKDGAAARRRLRGRNRGARRGGLRSEQCHSHGPPPRAIDGSPSRDRGRR